MKDVSNNPAANARRQQLDPANHLAVNFRLLVQRQKKTRRAASKRAVGCGEHVEQTVDDAWQIIDAGDQELQTQALSSQRDFGARS